MIAAPAHLTPPPQVPRDYKTIMLLLNRAGLDTYSYRSTDQKHAISLLRAPIMRLAAAADRVDYSMMVNENYLAHTAQHGRKDPTGAGNDIRPFPLGHDKESCKYGPYERIYAKYESDPDVSSSPSAVWRAAVGAAPNPPPLHPQWADLYFINERQKEFVTEKNLKHPFTRLDRIKLISNIVTGLEVE